MEEVLEEIESWGEDESDEEGSLSRDELEPECGVRSRTDAELSGDTQGSDEGEYHRWRATGMS